LKGDNSLNFDNIIGQQEIISLLKNSIVNNKINHANLFIGEMGIGKRTIAKIYAKNLLCKNMNICDNCIACKTVDSGANPDLKIVTPEKKKIGIDTIRDMQRDILILPVYSNYKVYIIEDADLMTIQAQNCLLKTLEEPPEYTLLILTAKSVNGILDTILSRTNKLYFKRNSFDEIEEYIDVNLGDIREKEFLINISDGVIGNIKKYISQENFIELRNNIINFIINLINKNKLKTINLIDLLDKNRDFIDDIFLIFNLFYRDLLVYMKTKNENLLINSDKKDIILDNISKISSYKIESNLDIINETKKSLDLNSNFNLSIEVMLLKLQEEII
jgi:DNA polymerase-3 subunit delta'